MKFHCFYYSQCANTVNAGGTVFLQHPGTFRKRRTGGKHIVRHQNGLSLQQLRRAAERIGAADVLPPGLWTKAKHRLCLPLLAQRFPAGPLQQPSQLLRQQAGLVIAPLPLCSGIRGHKGDQVKILPQLPQSDLLHDPRQRTGIALLFPIFQTVDRLPHRPFIPQRRSRAVIMLLRAVPGGAALQNGPLHAGRTELAVALQDHAAQHTPGGEQQPPQHTLKPHGKAPAPAAADRCSVGLHWVNPPSAAPAPPCPPLPAAFLPG